LACEAGTDLSVETEADLTVIELPANNLGGDLPDEVYSLTKLTKLIMDDNKNISGSISTLIGNLQDLIFFDLDHNNMDGSLPEELFTLTKLEALDLNSNQFTGALSPSIGNLSELVVLQIEDNLFSGDVPTDGLLALEKLGTCAYNQSMLYQGFEFI
jgi:Leucine-rich repeat (LRR) protein